MTVELSGGDRVNLLEFFKAVARRDGRTAAKCTLRLSKQQNCPNPKAFIKELGEGCKICFGLGHKCDAQPIDCDLNKVLQDEDVVQIVKKKVRRKAFSIQTVYSLAGW
ncbi:hypothetical protein POM88_007856 [Heracleum sosnowskyi]|uniref:Uncharacterized protein n=1 Tax=Heracleum sosnowskyi TaxID=360622 RepID=A0AAD8J7K6_9APIA|nr:hypothetical protein POM88_007856 [Heracleum sosnowskyi]